MGRPSRYSAEVRELAVRMVLEHPSAHDSQWAAISSIAAKIGCAPATLRKWPRSLERDRGRRAGLTTSERERLKKRRVVLLGEIDDPDLPGFYAGASCFADPPRYEGFGLQAIEAIAMGAPVALSSRGSLPEVVGDAALVFPVGDAKGLANCLEQVFTGRSLRDSLIQRGRHRAECFQWQKVVPNYTALYHRLLSRRSMVL